MEASPPARQSSEDAMGASPPLRLVARPAYHSYWGGAARRGSTGGILTVSSPATGALIANVAEASAEDVASACRSAGEAFPTWAAREPAERGRMMRKVGDLIGERIEDLA